MQAISPVTIAEVMAKTTAMRYKFEIYDGAAWQDLCVRYPGGASCLAEWAYRKKITVQTAYLDSNLDDFPLLVMLDADADIGAACQADGEDIRFTAADGVTLLPYERVSFAVAAGEATGEFWVKTDLATAGTHIWLYYGNAAAPDGEDAEAVWDSNFKAVYHMKDATTSTILDSTSNELDAGKKAANEPVEADGKIGKGQSFDATDDYIDAEWVNFGTDDFTIAAWVKATTPDTGGRRIFCKRDGSNVGVELYIETSQNTLSFFIGDAGGLTYGEVGGAIRDGLYHHIAVTFDRDGNAAAYVDGAPSGTPVSIASRSGTVSTSSAEYIGRSTAGAQTWNGILDEIRLSLVLRSAAWLKFEYRNMAEADNELTWGAAEPLAQNLLKSIAVTPSGAGPTPAVVAGTWSAEVKNPDGIFSPHHPTSAYSSYFRVGRQVRISIGGVYGGTAYWWQRIIGYMNAPQFDDGRQTVMLSGNDYSKQLADVKIQSPYNIWGGSDTFSTIATSSGLGAEIYDEADALEIGAGEANNITNWADDAACTAAAATDAGGGSTYVMRITKDTNVAGYTTNTNVGAVTAGLEYECSFKYELTPAEGGGSVVALLYVGAALDGWSANGESEAWVTSSFRFTASSSANMTLKFKLLGDAGTVVDIDKVSIKPVTTPGINTTYILPEGARGVASATLNGMPIFMGDPPEKFGWLDTEDSNLFAFVSGAIITAGTDNLVVKYYTDQTLENVVADLLAAGPGDAGGGAGLYANQAAALAAMSYTATGITLKKVWFPVGDSILSAVEKVCQRANYRFWFSYAGVPQFKAAPTRGDPVAWFEWGTVSAGGDRQDLEQIRNRVVIEGIEQATFKVGTDDKEKSRLKATASDAASIAAYLEHTESITNDLFQDQDALNAMCATILAERKDPKWFFTASSASMPLPLEIGDSVEFEVRLSATLTNRMQGVIRGMSLENHRATYTIETRSTVMNIANHSSGPVTVTAEYCKGWMLTNAGAGADVHFDLPAAVVGMEISFYVMAAQTITIDPNGTERIAVITGTAGDYLRSDNVIGSCITLACLVAGYWHKKGAAIGTWTEEA